MNPDLFPVIDQILFSFSGFVKPRLEKVAYTLTFQVANPSIKLMICYFADLGCLTVYTIVVQQTE